MSEAEGHEKSAYVVQATPSYAYDQPVVTGPAHAHVSAINDGVPIVAAGGHTYVQMAPQVQHVTAVVTPYSTHYGAHINDCFPLAVFTLICCCFPLNVVGLVYSVITREAKRYGDIARAKETASSTKCWLIFSIVFGVVLITGLTIYLVVAIQAMQYP